MGVAALGVVVISAAMHRSREEPAIAQTLLSAALILGGILAVGYAATHVRARSKEQFVADEMSDMPRITLPWGAIPAGVH